MIKLGDDLLREQWGIYKEKKNQNLISSKIFEKEKADLTSLQYHHNVHHERTFSALFMEIILLF